MTTSQAALALWIGIVAITGLYALRRRGHAMPISRSVPVIGTLFAVALFAVVIQGARMQVIQQDVFRDRTGVDPRSGDAISNVRNGLGLLSNPRGAILDASGKPIAWSIETADGYVRQYAPSSAATVAGYFSPLLYGAEGLEDTLNQALTVGINRSPLEMLRSLIGIEESRPETVELTLDAGLQQQAQDLLGEQAGAIVVINVKTGAVVAMASAPTIDPDKLAGITPAGVDAARQYWTELNDDSEHPLVRRATNGLYTPGSIFKVITTSGAIEAGVATPDSVYEDSGSINIDGRVLDEANRPDDSVSTWSLTEGLWYSLNVLYAQVGMQLGEDRLEQIADAFGFGHEIPFDFPVTESQLYVDSGFLDTDVAVAETAFGQGELEVTPLHMAMVAAAIANNGVMMKPYLVDKYFDADGNVLATTNPEVWRSPISASTADQVAQMMIGVVNYGYAYPAAQPGIIIGGKTGTAETSQEEPHGWFIGFGGTDEPEYAVAVVLEFGGSEGSRPAEIGGVMLDAAIADD